MRFLRTFSLIVLAAALGVGLYAGDAQAAFLDSVRVVSPASGTVRGIDSLITARAYFWTGGTPADSSIQVIFWVASKTTMTAALVDSVGARGAAEDSLAAVFGVGTLPWDFVAGRGYISPTRSAGNFADADTIIFTPVATPSGIGIGYIAEMRLRVPEYKVGEVTDLAVWATVFDSTAVGSQHAPRGFSPPLVAKDGHWFRVDGIRPLADPTKVRLNAVNGLGPSARFVATNKPDTLRALRAGDTLQVVYDLGTAFQDIYGLGLRATSLLHYGASTKQIDLGTIRRQIDTVNVKIVLGLYGDIAAGDSSGMVGVYLADAAGNLSSTAPGGPAQGLTKSANFLIDAMPPDLTAATGDTIFPVGNDTITDGGINTGGITGAMNLHDRRPFSYKLQEDLAQLVVAFDNADDAKDRTATLKAAPAGTQADPFVFGAGGLAAAQTRFLNLSKDGDSTLVDVLNAAKLPEPIATSNIAPISTGVYDIKLTGTDFAGNVGPQRVISNMYVDVDNIALIGLFPTKLAFGPTDVARTDTIEETTAIVAFQLSEPADSVVIRYRRLSGADAVAVRSYNLSGSELTRTNVVQQFPGLVDSLKHGTQYELSILARDLAGNYMVSAPDTFLYDTSFVVPLIQRFAVAAAPAVGLAPARHLIAGDQVVLTITADATTNGTRDAVTYKGPATLTVAKVQAGGSTGVTLTGSGVTDAGGGVASLSADGWLAGKRTVTLRNTTAVDTLLVSVTDATSAGGPYTGQLDSLIVYDPAAYTRIVVNAPAAAIQGEAFMVDVTLADVFGNRRGGDSRYVTVGANKVGVEYPAGPVYIQGGAGSFMAKAVSWVGEGLVFRVNDMVDANQDQDMVDANQAAGTIRDGVSAAVTVAGAGAAAVDAPDTLVAKDYLGADGLGDQGGFIMLTWDLSDDHADLSGYRIYREMMVDSRAGGEGEPPIVALPEPQLDWVAWGKVDAIPGATLGRAVVATLDNVASRWAIAAEMGDASSAIAKEAFDGAESLTAAYDLMAQTMVASRQAAAELGDGVMFASLSPEALAFISDGVVPQFRSVASAALLSPMTVTSEAVAAVDNIAPEPVVAVRAVDTPNDLGGSITVTWTKSVSDVLVSRNVPSAVGLSMGDAIPGVLGYRVYRQNGSEIELAGTVPAGESSFIDNNAVNGIRYTYSVRPFDADNEASALVVRGAMAIRNNVADVQGVPILGLFGPDNTVGFDDFFLFADQFGKAAGDEDFEPAFDLAASGKIDFEDFFLFADNFGRVANVGVAKAVPVLAGVNADARLYLDAGTELPTIGSEVAINVSLADLTELKGYGLSVSFDPAVLEFVRVVDQSGLLGGGELATAQVIAQRPGELAVGAYGQTTTEAQLGLSLVFRTKTEIEGTYVEVTDSEVRDGSFGVNSVALPAPVQIQTRPESYALGNNYPNPFNPATTIRYALPEAGFVKLDVYNVVGQLVRTLVADQQSAGRYVVRWDATDSNGQALSSGIYFYRLQAGGSFAEVKKMLLLK